MDISEAYTFDDLLLVPQYSSQESRKDPDTSVQLGSMKLDIPVIAAPMGTVCESQMLRAMTEIGATGVLHRYMSIKRQVEEFRATESSNVFVAVGASGDYKERALALMQAGARHFVIDVANGHNQLTLDAVKLLRELIPNGLLMAGNICTYEGAHALVEAGTDIIRVGVGPGSACTTRIVTGHGVPQLTAIQTCSLYTAYSGKSRDAYCVADGGIRTSGDAVKALAMGADAIMVGGLLAGTSQSPGESHSSPRGLFKYFHGMASTEGRKEWFSKEMTSFVPEGGSAKVPFKGDARRIIKELVDAIKVGMSYSGASTIKELQEKAKWVKITQNGQKESHVNRRMHNGG